MYSYAVICFLANCSGDNWLAILSIVAFFAVNAGTLTGNTVYRIFGFRGFQLARLMSLPFRLLVTARAWGGLSSSFALLSTAGVGIEVLTIVSAAVLCAFDLRNDFLQVVSRFASSKFEVIDTLPGNVYICKKIPRVTMMQPASSLSARVVGQKNKAIKGLTLIANIEGLIVELCDLTPHDYQSLSGKIPVYQTKTFDSDHKDYEAAKAQMRFDEQMKENEEREAERKKMLLEKQAAKDKAERKRLSVAMGLKK